MPSESTVSAHASDTGHQQSLNHTPVSIDNRRSAVEADLIRRRIAARRQEQLDHDGRERHARALVTTSDRLTDPLPADHVASVEPSALENQESLVGSFSEAAARIAKRSFDIIVSLLFLIAASPLLLALAWIVRRDGGAALYRHKRLGTGGATFDCIKFRSMIANSDRVLADLLAHDAAAAAEWTATQKLRNDPRVTPVGGFLRKTSLDELPQLLNVLRGEMSLVGPRPIVSAETRFYGEYIEDYYAARPGITGLWQVSGRSDTTYERRVQLDVTYVRNWSFWSDIIILLKTIPVVMLRGGAV